MDHVASLLIPSLILVAGIANDLLSRKVRNELVIAAFLVGLIYCFIENGTAGLLTGLLGLTASVVVTLPLVLFGILGSGDLKLFMAFGLVTTWEIVVYVAIAALIWGAVLGVLRALISGQLGALVKNTINVAGRKSPQALHRIPYTLALGMGWLSFLASQWRAS